MSVHFARNRPTGQFKYGEFDCYYLSLQLENTDDSLKRREKELSNMKIKFDQTTMQLEDLNQAQNTTLR